MMFTEEGVRITGRSDATLNPGGVRIGTAEIYRVVEAMDEVVDSIVIGRPIEGDVEVMLFVQLANGVSFDEAALVKKIRGQIRAGCTPRHVPAQVHAVPDIPYTISGKKVELAVRCVVLGEEVKNKDALKNPEALDFYQGGNFGLIGTRFPTCFGIRQTDSWVNEWLILTCSFVPPSNKFSVGVVIPRLLLDIKASESARISTNTRGVRPVAPVGGGAVIHQVGLEPPQLPNANRHPNF